MPTPQRNTIPVEWPINGCSDAIDGTNAFRGAQKTLTNLVIDPSTAGVAVPRPASVRKTDFTGAGAPSMAGVVSGRLVVGDIEYGMVSSSLNAGNDEPYAYNLATDTFLTIGGITAGNTPTAPPSSGEWTPPILAQVGNRVVVTHPGFPGGPVKYGWFDLSGAFIAFLGDTNSTRTNQARIISGNFNTIGCEPGLLISGTNIPANTATNNCFETPSTFISTCQTTLGSAVVNVAEMTGFEVGFTVYAAGIPAGATILARSAAAGAGTITLSAQASATGGPGVEIIATGNPPFTITTTATSGTITLNSVFAGDHQCYSAGQLIAGTGIPDDTFIVSVNVGAGTATLSKAATASGTINPIITGASIVMSQAATGATDFESITLTGGTVTAPLWGAGDTDIAPLPSVPVGVAQFNGRAYFACGVDGIPYSDALQASRRSSSAQALKTNDGLRVTAVAPLGLSTLTGGIVQSLLAFEGTNKIQQITGDQATSDLAMNALPVATGTAAPLSIVPCEIGTVFVSPDGVRAVTAAGAVTDPIGDRGKGKVIPFQYAVTASRICAAVNTGVLRITVQNGAEMGNPYQEWWYDFSVQQWTGPHSFPARLIQAWRNTFVITPQTIPASLWQSDPYPSPSSVYIENGFPLSWVAETVLLPDNAQMAMNAMIEANLACATPSTTTITVNAIDEEGGLLDTVSISPGAGTTLYRQRWLEWTKVIVFKQFSIRAHGPSSAGLRVGNLYFRREILGYNLDEIGAADNFLLDDYTLAVLQNDYTLEPLTPG